MENVGIVHYVSVAGGLALALATAYAIVKYTPTPYRNLFYAALALGMFAVGTGSKVAVSMSPDEGLKFQVTELERKLKAAQETIAALQLASPAEVKRLTAQVERLEGRSQKYDKFLAAFGEAVKIGKPSDPQYWPATNPASSTGEAVYFDSAKFKQLLEAAQSQ